MKQTVEIDVNIDSYINELAGMMAFDEAFDVIMTIDRSMGAWEFTLRLCDAFDELRKKYNAEQGE